MEQGSSYIFKMEYYQETQKAMKWLGSKKDIIVIGQTVEYPGSPMFASLKDVPKNKKIELPVIEDTQMGMSAGLSMNGIITVSIFPRIDFLICATNQLVNHLDKIQELTNGEFKPGVIIRTQIGNTKPLNPGIQHTGDYTEGLRKMLKMNVIKLENSKDIVKEYKKAYNQAKKGISTLLVETPQGPSEKNFYKVKMENRK
jgi:pyruvate/2-oxoglutarate/acetoin dehydrogenase E1 component